MTDKQKKPRERLNFCVLHNPAAGRDGVGLVEAVIKSLRARGAAVTSLAIDQYRPLDADAAERQFDALIVSGGDGTVRSIAAEHTLPIPVGIIPNGTANVLAAELALPARPSDLADVFMRGPTRLVRGGAVGEMRFLLMFGAGFDGEVVRRVARPAVRAFGKLAYTGPILRTLIQKPKQFQIDTDGAVSAASWLLVTNASLYAGRFRLTDQTSVDRPDFIAVISRATKRRERFCELARLVFGRLAQSSTIETCPIQQAAVLTSGVAMQIDGEPVPSGSYRIRAVSRGTELIAGMRQE
jgi:diacylglycerol kinase family enzyme